VLRIPYNEGVKISVEQAKAQLDTLIERSAAGEEIVITRDGEPVAQVVPPPKVSSPASNNGAPKARKPRTPGWGKGIIKYISPDFDEPLEDFREYME